MFHYVFSEAFEELLEIPRRAIRKRPISEDLRGWNYANEKLELRYRLGLPMYAIASRYCPTGRDIYLTFVKKVSIPRTKAMILGLLYHRLLAKLVEEARALYLFL
jgi:CRISPR-associated protein Csa1